MKTRCPGAIGTVPALTAAVLTATGSMGVARAQGAFAIVPSIDVSQRFDSNVFSTPSTPQADVVTDVRPMVEAKLRTIPLAIGIHAAAGLERFAHYSELTSAGARLTGGFDVEYRRTPRTTLAAQAEIARTRTPSELSLETGLALPRARASRARGGGSLTRLLDPRTEGRIEVAVQQLRVVGAPAVRQETGSGGINRRWSSRSAGTIDYRVDRFVFDGSRAGTGTAVVSHTMTTGVTRAITGRITLSIAAGPRITAGSVAADLSAAIRLRQDRAGYSLGYSRSQTSVFGVPVPVDVETVMGNVTWTPSRRLHVRLAPAVLMTRADNRSATVTRFELEIAHPVGRGLTLHAGVDSALQRGRLHAGDARTDVVRHTAAVRLVATSARHR